MRRRKKFFFLVPVVLLFVISGMVMWLWNAILPEVVGVQAISYWQAMGTLVLSKILFGGFHGCRPRGGGRDFQKKREFFRKMKNMSPEERAKFKEIWKQRSAGERFCSK